MFSKQKVSPSGGESYTSATEMAFAGAPNARKIIRVRLLTDWYACTWTDAEELAWYPQLEGEQVNDYATNVDTTPEAEDNVGNLHNTETVIRLRDVLGTINNALLAVEKDGEFYMPKGTEVYCYLPYDSTDGHYEPLNFGTSCPKGSGSAGSEGSESGSGSGESGSGSGPPSLCDELVGGDVCWLGCDGGYLRHKIPYTGEPRFANCSLWHYIEGGMCSLYFDDAGHLIGWHDANFQWQSPWGFDRPT